MNIESVERRVTLVVFNFYNLQADDMFTTMEKSCSKLSRYIFRMKCRGKSMNTISTDIWYDGWYCSVMGNILFLSIIFSCT